jgi:hypothetical protein
VSLALALSVTGSGSQPMAAAAFQKQRKPRRTKSINQKTKQPTMFVCFTFPLKPEKNATKC